MVCLLLLSGFVLALLFRVQCFCVLCFLVCLAFLLLSDHFIDHEEKMNFIQLNEPL